MPQWIHDRADRIRAENPTMPESESFAISTQQAHKLGKTPKGYGTAKGKREAMKKYDEPKSEYQKTAMLIGLFDELDKIAKVNPAAMRELAEQAAKRAAQHRKKGKEKGSQGMGMDAGGAAGGGPAAAAASAPPPPPPPPPAGGGMGAGGGAGGPGGMM